MGGEWVRERLGAARLYLCTPDRADLGAFVDAALAGGVDIVQLRDKTLEAKQELAALAIMAEAGARHGALLAAHDRAGHALGAGAGHPHIGDEGLAAAGGPRGPGEE